MKQKLIYIVCSLYIAFILGIMYYNNFKKKDLLFGFTNIIMVIIIMVATHRQYKSDNRIHTNKIPRKNPLFEHLIAYIVWISVNIFEILGIVVLCIVVGAVFLLVEYFISLI